MNLQSKYHIALFAGGSGVHRIHLSLANQAQVTRIVPVCDDGGSSKQIRDYFRVLPVGDLRNALMTAAYSQGVEHAVIRFFQLRLPKDAECVRLKRQLRGIIADKGEDLARLPANIKEAIQKYLKVFIKNARGFDLRGGCLGNFIIMGAWMTHRTINTAIKVLSEILNIHSEVWPVSLDNNLQLIAQMECGKEIIGQASITSIDRLDNLGRIQNIYYPKTQGLPRLNPIVHEKLQQCDMLVFGPGSFFTSVLPHLMIDGFAEMIAKQNIPKIFITNTIIGNECFGYQAHDLVRLFLAYAERFTHRSYSPKSFLTHVLSNQSVQTKQMAAAYLQPGRPLPHLQLAGIEFILGDFEDLWQSGKHDGEKVVQTLLSILSQNDKTYPAAS